MLSTAFSAKVWRTDGRTNERTNERYLAIIRLDIFSRNHLVFYASPNEWSWAKTKKPGDIITQYLLRTFIINLKVPRGEASLCLWAKNLSISHQFMTKGSYVFSAMKDQPMRSLALASTNQMPSLGQNEGDFGKLLSNSPRAGAAWELRGCYWGSMVACVKDADAKYF